MVTIRDIMSTDVITVPPEMTIRDAMDLFAAHHVSGAPVVSGRRVMGVVTATDLIAFASTSPGAPTFRDDEDSLGDLESEPDIADEVEQGDQPVPAFWTSMWENVGADTAVRMDTPDAPEWSVLDEHTVDEAMTPAVFALPPDATVSAAADYMQRYNVHRVLVMDGRDLLGIVTTTDVARAVAEHRLSQHRFVFGRPEVREDGSRW